MRALGAALLVLVAVGALLGATAAVGVGWRSGRVEGVDWAGAATFGAVVGLTFVAQGLITVVGAQLTGTAFAARVVGAGLLAGGFGVRATADAQDLPWLSWGTPLGLRALTAPFTDDRLGVALAAAAGCAGLVVLTVVLERRRELGAGLVRLRATTRTTRPISSMLHLAWRLDRAAVGWWLVGITAGAAVFAALGSGVVDTAREGGLDGGVLGTQLAGGDPVGSYLRYAVTVVAILVAALVILVVSRAAADERAGPGSYLRTLGSSTSRPLAVRIAVGSGAAVAATLLAGVALAAVAAVVLPDLADGGSIGAEVARRALQSLPGALALMGLTALLAGWRPSLVWLAWLPYGVSAALVLLGPTVGLADPLLRIGLFAPDVDAVGQGARVLLAATGVALGLVTTRHRDVQ